MEARENKGTFAGSIEVGGVAGGYNAYGIGGGSGSVPARMNDVTIYAYYHDDITDIVASDRPMRVEVSGGIVFPAVDRLDIQRPSTLVMYLGKVLIGEIPNLGTYCTVRVLT